MAMTDRSRTIGEIERYWLQAGLPKDAVANMRQELEQHLSDADADGRTLADVIGADPGAFAESWAVAYRGKRRSTATWQDFRSGTTARAQANRRDLWMYGIGTVAVLAAAALAGQGGSDVEDEVWRWLWTGLAVVMGIGEIFTAGFFLLPFAIGAGTAAVLAWIGAAVIAQWLVFFGVSIFSMAFLRRFIERQDEGDQPVLGANRWVSTQGIVLEDIDPDSGSGMVRIESEEWRASAPQPISKGTRIIVTEVTGTKLVVEPIESA
jgi:membrane protein implicated in regulation of membrane protease activity